MVLEPANWWPIRRGHYRADVLERLKLSCIPDKDRNDLAVEDVYPDSARPRVSPRNADEQHDREKPLALTLRASSSVGRAPDF